MNVGVINLKELPVIAGLKETGKRKWQPSCNNQRWSLVHYLGFCLLFSLEKYWRNSYSKNYCRRKKKNKQISKQTNKSKYLKRLNNSTVICDGSVRLEYIQLLKPSELLNNSIFLLVLSQLLPGEEVTKWERRGWLAVSAVDFQLQVPCEAGRLVSHYQTETEKKHETERAPNLRAVWMTVLKKALLHYNY